MKKENVFGLIVYVVILGLAVVFGLVILQKYFEMAGDKAMSSILFALFILGAVVTGIIFNAIMFELAHCLGAKIGGYKIVSCSVLGLTFYKDNGKTKVRFGSYDGLTGETKIIPLPNRKKESNPTWYLLLGALFFVVEIAIAVFMFSYITATWATADRQWGFFILTAAVVGGMILLYNIIPLRLDSMTDGYRLTQVSGAKNRKAFNNLLRIENGEQINLEDATTQEIVETSSFSTDIKLNKLYELLDKRDYAGAIEVLDNEIISNPKTSKQVYIRARAQKIYAIIMSKPLDEAKEFYEKEVSLKERRVISDDVSMDSIRAYILMSGLFDKSRSECYLALKKLLRAYKGVPEQRKELEKSMFNEALKKVIEAHPTWELENYLMIEEEKAQ